jgi:nuclear pore complex protein Nup133
MINEMKSVFGSVNVFILGSTAVSVHISADGWAWFVCGRRLLIWQYKQTLDAGKQRRVLSSQCRELTLPPSDLAHRADLVSVYIAEGSQVSRM